MAQIKKGFIAPNAIDGSKLRLLNNEAIRALAADGTDVELLKIDVNSVLQFLRIPQVSVDPIESNDLVRKGYTDSTVSSESARAQAAEQALQNDLAQEVSDREAGDANLQSQVDAEKARIDAILLASDADKDSFAEIVQLINSVDTENDSAFASYVLSNDAALAQEVSNRQSADNALDARLDVLEADPVTKTYVDAADASLQAQIDALDSSSSDSVADEAAARIAADNALDARLDVLEGSDTTEGSVAKAEKDAKDHADSIVAAEQAAREAADADLQYAIDAEAFARFAADTTLQANIDVEKSRIDAILLAADADKDSFAEIVQLINSVDTENDSAFASYVLSNNAALAQEVSNREAGDSQLQSNLDAEEAAREAADGVLQSNINSESSARQAADTTLQSNIDSEAAARQSADEALDVRVDALEAVVEGRAKFVISQANLNNQYLDLPYEAKPDSTFMFYGPLYLHEGDDYTVSTVNGVSRLSFAGRIAAGEPNQPIVGDTIYVRYKHSGSSGTGGGGGGDTGGGGNGGGDTGGGGNSGPQTYSFLSPTPGEYDSAWAWLGDTKGQTFTGISGTLTEVGISLKSSQVLPQGSLQLEIYEVSYNPDFGGQMSTLENPPFAIASAEIFNPMIVSPDWSMVTFTLASPLVLDSTKHYAVVVTNNLSTAGIAFDAKLDVSGATGPGFGTFDKMDMFGTIIWNYSEIRDREFTLKTV